MVYGVYLLEIIQTILVTHDAFAIFGYGFGDLENMAAMHLDWLTVPIMSGVGELLHLLYQKVHLI